jgi:outer membrane protein assembly factor BamD (BamD/ComL family)
MKPSCLRQIVAAGCLLVLFASCALPPSLQRVLGRPDAGQQEASVLMNPTDEYFLKSDQLFRDGNYREALRRTRRIYKEASDPAVEEEALFRIAVILAYGDNRDRDYKEAADFARNFLKQFPESRRTLAIKSILGLILEVRRGEAEISTLKGYNTLQEEKILRLQEDLLKIKEIDVQLEEQKKKLE